MEQKFGINSLNLQVLREFCEHEGKMVEYRKGDQLEREGDSVMHVNVRRSPSRNWLNYPQFEGTKGRNRFIYGKTFGRKMISRTVPRSWRQITEKPSVKWGEQLLKEFNRNA